MAQDTELYYRTVCVMLMLVNTYNYPPEGAAGLVGNLVAESGLVPNRVEGSRVDNPMRTRDHAGIIKDFSATDVRDRIYRRQGPNLPGIGLAQWTTQERRSGLFQHHYEGVQLGAHILFHTAAQVDYLVRELQTQFPGVERALRTLGVLAASDEVVYSFERPGSILANGRRLPRNDPSVQGEFERRRPLALQALHAYNEYISRD